MTVQTTTLPAANPIRLGSQPIRRRALVPQVSLLETTEAAEAVNDDHPAGPGDEQHEQQDSNEQQELPETDLFDAAAHAAETAAPTPPARRGRGRPRKNVVDVIVEGRPTTPVQTFDTAAIFATPDQTEFAAVGAAVVAAAKLGVSLEAYIQGIRGTLAAYDRLVLNKSE